MTLAYELWVLPAVLVAVLIVPGVLARVNNIVDRGLATLGARPGLCVIGCAILAGCGAAAFAFFVFWPVPAVHDEFSYLLAAETFAKGRLVNPPHPMWQQLETFHILQQPNYASKYPPAQGLSLAPAIALFGDAAPGLWMQAMLMTGSIAWMLFGWLPPRWAALGAVLVTLRFGVSGYWVHTYWGGGVAAIGGALVLGSLPRIMRRPRWTFGCVLGSGLAVLANSRPLEGGIVGLVVAAVLLIWLVKGTNRRARIVALLPVLVILIATAAWMGYYNWRITGSATQLPYSLHQNQYGVCPPFLWMDKRPVPAFRHNSLRLFATLYESAEYDKCRTLAGYGETLVFRLKQFVVQGIGAALVLPLLFLLPIGRRRRRCQAPVRFALATCGLVALVLCATSYFQVHYTAPITALLIFLIVVGWRRMRRAQWLGRRRSALSFTLLIAVLVGAIIRGLDMPRGLQEFGLERPQVEDRVSATPGEHVIFVQYGDNFVPHQEFVFNHADIEGSRVIWVRASTAEANVSLAQHFADRTLWSLILSDDREARLYKLRDPIRPR